MIPSILFNNIKIWILKIIYICTSGSVELFKTEIVFAVFFCYSFSGLDDFDDSGDTSNNDGSVGDIGSSGWSKGRPGDSEESGTLGTSGRSGFGLPGFGSSGLNLFLARIKDGR